MVFSPGSIGGQKIMIPQQGEEDQFGASPERDISLRQRAGGLLRRALEGIQEFDVGPRAAEFGGAALRMAGEIPGEIRALPGELIEFGNLVRSTLGGLAQERREFFERGSEVEFPVGDVLEEQGGVAGAIRRRREREEEALRGL